MWIYFRKRYYSLSQKIIIVYENNANTNRSLRRQKPQKQSENEAIHDADSNTNRTLQHLFAQRPY